MPGSPVSDNPGAANQISLLCAPAFLNELGTGGLLAPVVICREKDWPTPGAPHSRPGKESHDARGQLPRPRLFPQLW